MVRIPLFLFLCLCISLADVLEDKVRNLIGSRNYQLNANFINKIFANKNLYYTGGRLDVVKVVYALKSNGLLSSRFGQPNEVKLSFSARTSPVLLAKVGNDILSSMGYSYFMVSRAKQSSGLSTMEFSFNTEHSPDMGIILDELGERGFACLDINRVGAQQWDYILEVSEPRLPNTKFMGKGGSLNLRDPSGEYWIALNSGGNLFIQSSVRWNPRIVLYDQNLGIVDLISDTGLISSLKLNVPSGVKFMMITDYDNSENLKSGISLNFH